MAETKAKTKTGTNKIVETGRAKNADGSLDGVADAIVGQIEEAVADAADVAAEADRLAGLRETRCYLISGAAWLLNCVEIVVGCLGLMEEGSDVQTLASWIDDTER